MCGSLLNIMSPNCTRFDGQKFENISSTSIGHTFGAMVTFDNNPTILGGYNYGDIDFDQVETFENEKWDNLKPLPEPMRLFSAIALNTDQMVVFGGFSGKKNASLSGTYWFNQMDNMEWSSGPGTFFKDPHEFYYKII